MSKRFIFLLLIMSLQISGCMPFWIHDYYRPDATSGVAKKSGCHGISGPPDTMEFIRNEVIIRVSAHEIENGVYMFIRFEIPNGREVRLANSKIHVVTSPTFSTLEGLLKPLQHYGWSPTEVTETMSGKTNEQKTILGTYRYGRYYALDAQFASPKVDEIKVRIPSFYINGNNVELPELLFKKDKYLELFVPLNC